MLLVTGQQPPRGPGIPVALSYAVLEELCGGVFETLEDHMKDMEPDNNHVYPLIKAVYQARLHQNIRMHHLTNQHNAQITGKVVRKEITELILFKRH